MRVAYTAGEAIGPEIFRFFRALGMNLKQLYGQTEASRLHHGAAGRRDLRRHRRQAKHRRRDEDRGQWRGAVQVARRILGYYKDPEKTAETKTAGRLGAHRRRRLHRPKTGHLKIIDRAKDVGRLNRRHDVRAEISREQAQVLSQDPRSGGLRRQRDFVC